MYSDIYLKQIFYGVDVLLGIFIFVDMPIFLPFLFIHIVKRNYDIFSNVIITCTGQELFYKPETEPLIVPV